MSVEQAIEEGMLCASLLHLQTVRILGALEVAYEAAGGGELGMKAALSANTSALNSFALFVQARAMGQDVVPVVVAQDDARRSPR